MWWDSFRLWWHCDDLSSTNVLRRLRAVDKLPLRPPARVASFLHPLLDDPDEEVRAAVATKLGCLKSRQSIPLLVRLLLHERNPIVHSAVSLALAALPADGWVPLLVAALDDRDATVCEYAAGLLRTSGWAHIDDAVRGKVAVIRSEWEVAVGVGPAAVTALKVRLRTGTAFARREAAGALCKIADSTALDAILDVLRDRRVESNAREAAAWALRSVQWSEVQPADAARAAIVLGRWSEAAEVGTDAVAPLVFALRDTNVAVRRSAAETLGQIANRAAEEALAAALVDPSQDPAIRSLAARELAHFGGEFSIGYLATALNDKDWSVRVAVATALYEMHWHPTRPWDRALYAIAGRNIEEAVAVGPAAIPALTDALRFPAVSADIGAALAGMGPDGTSALAAISKDPKADHSLREAASTALASIGDHRAMEPLYEMLQDPDPVIRNTAVWSLERLGWRAKSGSEKAVVALAHEDWDALQKIGVAAVDPLTRHISHENGDQDRADILYKIVSSAPSRLSIDQLRRIVRLDHPSRQEKSDGNTTTLAPPAMASVIKTARYELMRRGIMK